MKARKHQWETKRQTTEKGIRRWYRCRFCKDLKLVDGNAPCRGRRLKVPELVESLAQTTTNIGFDAGEQHQHE